MKKYNIDDIKETLEYKIDFLTKSLNIGIPTKNRRYFYDIKDYITNLQQENERLKWDKEQLNSLVNSCQDEIIKLKLEKNTKSASEIICERGYV